MMCSGTQVVHHIANGISKRIVGGPVVCVLRPFVVRLNPPDGLPAERLVSKEDGGWYRPILKPCILADFECTELWLRSSVETGADARWTKPRL
jgi:hypothetical protein